MIPNKEFCDKFGGKLIDSAFGNLCAINYGKLSEVGPDLERIPRTRNEFSALVILYDYDLDPYEKKIIDSILEE